MTLAHDTGLSRQIIGLAMRVHTRLGPGLLERVYERCLSLELDRHQIPHQRQVEVPLEYDGIAMECGFRPDMIVRDEIVLELKSIDHVLPIHGAQLLTYMRFTGCKVGILLNFNTVALKDGILRRVL